MAAIELVIAIIIIICYVYYYLYIRKLYSSNYIIKGNTDIDADKLMIVAHPDDETIFGGRYLIENHGWKVICVTNASSKSSNTLSLKRYDRRKDFIYIMNKLKCQYEIWDYEDNKFNANWNKNKLLTQLKNLFLDKKYKIVLTHNLDGEYGHIQHKCISRLVHEINPKNLYVFYLDMDQINPCYQKVMDLLKIYRCQNNIISKLNKYILHQSIKKVN
ncbi:putative N-acetylglucosaminyl phosphatidylinositol deacetylase [Powai lake megavirus]|uniref:Putative N-acetylglucosaminyl phosphatidylinositol deacetylase n=1 Tax=Powai lake megavirus TaxID=1842663 RepID=A0A167RFS9_9VIRU|nr:putative N-acetylglucosaminyl phosphatidylinositol deacetylase [Powai lake megavirus]ANB50632.1 putative N-acetylglucosaminyl phosphatidylinositol deacetylase [Powai lake megavirus]